MHPALWISKTGLDAAQTDVAVVSNNLANASTVGFKKDRAVFEDLLYQNINQPGGRSSADTELPSGLMLGSGSKVVATQKAHTQGNLLTTENALDMSIQGLIYPTLLTQPAYNQLGRTFMSRRRQAVHLFRGSLAYKVWVISLKAR